MLNIEQQANRWVVRESEHGLSEVERGVLDAWCAADARHYGAYLRARAVQGAMEDACAHSDRLPIRDVGDAEVQAPAPAPDPQHTRRQFYRWGALAAGLAVLAALTTWQFQPAPQVFSTAVGELRKVSLADHSTLHINSASLLEVSLGSRVRAVNLKQGEAWFNVASDQARPFTVQAGDAHVRAVGTAFSVRRHSAGAEVLVTEGVVEIWRGMARSGQLRLSAGQRASLPAGAGAITVADDSADIQRQLAWRDGRVAFSSKTTLAEAVAEFNRYTRKPIEIADPALGRRSLAGRYKIDDPEQFARDVAHFMAVPVSIREDRIVIGSVRAQRPREGRGRDSALK